ncbi:A24 family peptidase [uncultured Adlercreutzia sp.]|uniref:prepilin peptidase n=1 Tax=uncultured Adlercreutzia sp. TaxID=875803 RepID=UPI0026F3C52E|nr:A24 family peptidase [uncultured Adlercreutzia sp.]
MTYVSVITLVAYGLVVALLGMVAVIDGRTRRIPNALSGALVVLWVLWRLVLGLAGKHLGLGFKAEVLGPAPDVMVPPGLEIGGISFASGILGAVILGGGLLVLTTVYELVTRKESFGGGDIKLMAALGLFLGVQRGLVCLLAACVLSLLYAGLRALVVKVRGARAPQGPAASGATEAGEALGLAGAAPSEAGNGDSLLGGTLPFGPFIALGTLVAFVA